MTEHPTKLTPGRHPLFYTFLVMLLLATAWIVYFLASFDLNNYRERAEKKLSDLLATPVTLGEIHYKFNEANLALQIDGLQLGDDTAEVHVDSRSILVNLQWQGLLERDFKFSKISLLEPHIRLRKSIDRNSAEGVKKPATTTTAGQAFLQKISINALEIINGTVQIESRGPALQLQSYEVTEFEAELSNLNMAQTCRFDMSGRLKMPGQKGDSPWHLQGEGSLTPDENNELAPHFNIDLDTKDLEVETLKVFFAQHLAQDSATGTSDLSLHLAGSPAKGIDFQISLSSKGLKLRPGHAYTNPIVLKNLLASGRLQLYGDQPGINDLAVQFDETRLAGQISWKPASEPFSMTITLLNSSLEIPRLKEWFPDQPQGLQRLKTHLQDQGSVQIERAQLLLGDNPETLKKWRLEHIKGELLQVGLASEGLPEAEIISLPFDIVDSHWQLDNGTVRLGSVPLTLQGQGEYDGSDLLLSALDIRGEIESGAFLEEWQFSQNMVETKGQIGFQGHLEGRLDHLSLDLQANLSQFNVRHPSGLEFRPGPEDHLALHGTLTPAKINLDHGALKWSEFKGHASGSYLPKAPDSLVLDAFLSINDLARATESLPLLKRLQLHGQADLSIRQRGSLRSKRPDMTLTLRDVGLHATRFIADLNQINGRAKLTETGIMAEGLRVNLGQSPLTVQAEVKDLEKPRLLLDVRAPAIHANDLVFKSDKAMLRNIEGHLEIDRDGLTFAPVEVRLDGGTSASVRGTVSFHPPFDVFLDISSEFADIGEVIRLWTDHSGKAQSRTGPVAAKATVTKTTVRINALVKEGDLYGMTFHNASGVITPTRERLTIHPLQFSVGEGSCNAQVISTFSSEHNPSTIQVSGHAEDVDALEVYRELLNQKSILRGKLRGDFFVKGETGPSYLASSYGNFSIRVKDGVLHQFPVLSKIFSLLNVSQIFALQLPDMDREGMPFSTLTANLELDKGVLKSNDLKIDSEAMNQSYLGEINLVNKVADFSVGINPLGTVDKIVSRIPVAGWLLTGDDKALLTAHFSVKGKIGDVSVAPLPLDTLSEPTLGLLRRTVELPFKLVEDPQIIWGGDGTQKPDGED